MRWKWGRCNHAQVSGIEVDYADTVGSLFHLVTVSIGPVARSHTGERKSQPYRESDRQARVVIHPQARSGVGYLVTNEKLLSVLWQEVSRSPTVWRCEQATQVDLPGLVFGSNARLLVIAKYRRQLARIVNGTR